MRERPDASKFRRLAVGSTDGRVWLIDLSDPSNAPSCNIEQPVKASITAHGDILLVAATDHSLRALAVTASGVDEKWAYYSNLDEPLANREDKRC